MGRRGEGQFVATEVNLRNDPKVLGMARRLKIHRLHAVGLLCTWREFVLERGTGTGLVKGYSRAEVAEFLDWPRAPAVLFDALKGAGYLTSRRGGAFVYPGWAETITGHYAHKKAADRDRKKGQRAAAEGGEEGDSARGTSADIPRNGRGASAEVPSGSGQEVSKSPPGPPGSGGASQPSAPSGWWEWFRDMHPKVRNPRKCRRLLGLMEREDLDQLWYCLPIHAPLYRDKEKKKAWRFVPFADSYLEDGTFWEHRPPKPKTTNGASKDGAAEAELLAKKLDEEAQAEKAREQLHRRAVVIERMRQEGKTIKRMDPAFEEEVERRMDAGEGVPS
jgi:hypothetical protein